MRFVHYVVCCIYLGVFPKAKIESGVGTIEVIQPAVPTKRKVIGTIQNTRLLFLGWRVYVLVHTSASLQNARSRFHRIQRQPAAALRSLFSFSLSPLLTHTLSLPRPPRLTDIYSYIGVDQLLPPAAARSLLLFESNPRRVSLSRPSINFERQL